MSDYFEIDFLDVEADASGDAITLRYKVAGQTFIHVVDGGYQLTGDSIVQHIRKHYDGATHVDHVVVTHCDADHTGGLRTVLEEMSVGTLWMLRPWEYAADLFHRFPTYTDVGRLRSKLRSAYSSLVELEGIALRRGIQIREPFQGAQIGAFTVLSPTPATYLDLIAESDKTPVTTESEAADAAIAALYRLMEGTREAAWGDEAFSPGDTSPENEMSVVQYAQLSGKKILLTGDAGRRALNEAAMFTPWVGLQLPGIDRFQIPHHGSRRNLSSDLLNRWVGGKLDNQPAPGQEKFTAIVSSAKKDKKHPRHAVVRALMHRGAKVIATESRSIRTSGGAVPKRDGWEAVAGAEYPTVLET